jgi:excisionase family DNA binding protein
VELDPLNPEPLWKMSDLCRYTGSDRTTVVRWTQLEHDPLPFKMAGRTYRFDRRAVMAWLDRSRCTSPAPGEVA